MTTDQPDEVYRRQGFGAPLGIHPPLGLLIVDFVNGFANPALFGGGNIADAIASTVPILDAARSHRWPVAHTRIVYANDGSDANIFALKVPSLLALTENADSSQHVAIVAPKPGELVIRKTSPSAFTGTCLAAWLIQRAVRSLVVAGCTTSGCVRASVVDAMAYGFRPIVLSDCVGDRAMSPHAANLFDMGQKNADVMTSHELLAHLTAEARLVRAV